MIEASGINKKIYDQALSRIRQDVMKVYKETKDGEFRLVKDKTQILLESNPTAG
ncbi:MAG: hypothetical protein ACRCXT_23760 [Paraclostridium sp.]